MVIQEDQLPVGPLPQLVEHCIGIAEVKGPIPLRYELFFRLSPARLNFKQVSVVFAIIVFFSVSAISTALLNSLPVYKVK